MAEKKKNVIVVVNGYDCHLDSPLGWAYLPKVVKFILENRDSIMFVICCGGFTQRKTASGVSEAFLSGEYIRKELKRECPEIYLEYDSYTSYGNIEEASNGISKIANFYRYNTKNFRIVIFCEATRSANVIMLARHFMLKFVESIDDITVETASWERADPFKQAFNLIYNKLAITFPWLRLAEREQAKRIRLSEGR